jgi:hypothetical protein
LAIFSQKRNIAIDMDKMTFDVVCSLNEVIDVNVRAFDNKARPKVNKVVATNMTGADGNETVKTVKRIKYLTRKKIVHGQVEMTPRLREI